MIEKAPRFEQSPQITYGHVFYPFHNEQKYVENAAAFIVSGVKQGDYILFVENHKLLPVIQKKAHAFLTKDELANVHYMNNFDFYFSTGSFHPPVIFEHFTKNVEPHLKRKKGIKTWGHVEWRDQTEIERQLHIYEQKVEEFCLLNGTTSVCAYNADRLTPSLYGALKNHHQFLMEDDDF